MFMLHSCPKVFRTIRVPMNYYFGRIYQLLQYTFSGSNLHLHWFDVTGPFKFYNFQGKKSVIKKPGKDRLNIHIIGHRAMDDLGARFSRAKTI
jgi:hypothetical protein